MAGVSDDEYETEEILLFAEIDGLLCPEILEHDSICVPTFKIVGLDTDKPYMQIGKETFEGEYQDRIGTALFFEKDPHPSGDDPTFRKVPENPLRYYGKSDKNLCFSRVFLKPKKEPEQRDVTQPIYIDSKDLEALAASDKEYLQMIESLKHTDVGTEIPTDEQDGHGTEKKTTEEVSEVQILEPKSSQATDSLVQSSSTERAFASTSKATTESAVTESDPSALAQVSQLICEQMDIDNSNILQQPPM